MFKDLEPKTEKQINGWMDTIEKLNRIDGLEFNDIIHLTQKTRNDAFWSKNFLSINKLRLPNKEGIPYWKVFFSNAKNSTNQNNNLDYAKLIQERRNDPNR